MRGLSQLQPKCLCSWLCLFTLVWGWRLPGSAAAHHSPTCWPLSVYHRGNKPGVVLSVFWGPVVTLSSPAWETSGLQQSNVGPRVHNQQTRWPNITQHFLKKVFPGEKGTRGWFRATWRVWNWKMNMTLEHGLEFIGLFFHGNTPLFVCLDMAHLFLCVCRLIKVSVK